MQDIPYFQRRIWFAAAIIICIIALAIPGFYRNDDMQTKLALAIPCIIAGAVSLPPLLVRTMNSMIRTYERITGRRVQD